MILTEPEMFFINKNWAFKAKKSCIEIADNQLKGYLQYFGKESKFIGFPPNWSSNPYEMKNFVNTSKHWSENNLFNQKDIK